MANTLILDRNRHQGSTVQVLLSLKLDTSQPRVQKSPPKRLSTLTYAERLALRQVSASSGSLDMPRKTAS